MEALTLAEKKEIIRSFAMLKKLQKLNIQRKRHLLHVSHTSLHTQCGCHPVVALKTTVALVTADCKR